MRIAHRPYECNFHLNGVQNDSATNEASPASCACCRRSRFGCKCGKRGEYNLEFRDQRLLACNRANSVATGAPSLIATSGPFSATASGNTAAITAISPVYQDALFTSGGFTVAAYAWGNGGNTQDKVTQSNNYATTINGASVHITGLGDCSSLCSGFSTTLSDTEWLTLALGSHPGWSLQSIVFGDVMNSPGEQVEFWFSNDATRSAAISAQNTMIPFCRWVLTYASAVSALMVAAYSTFQRSAWIPIIIHTCGPRQSTQTAVMSTNPRS